MSDNGPTAPRRWEYEVIHITPGNPIPAMNKAGNDGWQILIPIKQDQTGTVYLMKREKSLLMTPQEAMRALRDGMTG